MQQVFFSDRKRFLLILLAFLVLLFTYLWTSHSLHVRWDSIRREAALPSPQTEAAFRVQNPKLFKALTFGHWPLAVDWLWLRALQDAELSHVDPGTHPRAFYDLDLATDLDPAFFEAYVDGGNLLIVVRDDEDGTLKLLHKAERFRKYELSRYPERFRERFWNQAWAIPLLLAYTHLFELDDLPRAAVSFREAAAIPGAPAYLQDLEKRLATRSGQFQVGMKLINFMIEGAQEEKTKRRLEEKRRSLHLSQYLHDLNQMFKQYLLQNEPRFTGAAALPDRVLFKHWKEFRVAYNVPAKDPWGGEISFKNGRIRSSTRREAVFGLE